MSVAYNSTRVEADTGWHIQGSIPCYKQTPTSPHMVLTHATHCRSLPFCSSSMPIKHPLTARMFSLSGYACLQDPAVVQEEARAQLPPETDAVGEGACRVRVRLPDGSNLTRKFLKIYPLETLRLFCIASSPEAASGKPFNLLQTGRGETSSISHPKETLARVEENCSSSLE